jgi:lipopolysaccharide export system protein LptC
MKERFPSLIAVILLLALVAGTYWAADYAQRAVAIDPPRRLTHEMDAWGRDFVMLRSDITGQPTNRLEGDYIKHFPDNDSYEINAPRAIGLQPGNPVTIGVSKTAVMDSGGKRIVMNGDAHVHRNADAEREPLDVRSQQLIILPDDDVVQTEQPAQVDQGPNRMNGKGMHYNNKTRQLQVFSASNVEIAGSAARARSKADLPPPTVSPPKKP